MKIESKDTSIMTLLDGSYFEIPRFQRPYSWDEENINEFWKDLIDNKDEEYFIGSMVVYKSGAQRFGVVDGQQRLTTITILLCVIRDMFKSIDKNAQASGLHQLIERKNIDNENEYVLQTETSFPYFQDIIQSDESEKEIEHEVKQEEKKLEKAHNQFKRLINKALTAIDDDTSIPDKKKLDLKSQKLVSIRDTIRNLNLILITLENEDDAYLIFETLNTRGKDLALTDLIKNHLFKLKKAKTKVDAAKIKWTSILQTIHNSSADISSDTYFYHFWSSRYESTPLKKLFPKFKKEVNSKNATSYLDALHQDAAYYRAIHEPSYMWNKNEAELVKSLQAYNLFKLSQPTPALLSLIRAYKDEKIKYAKLRDSVKTIEKFHFFFTAITSSRSSGGISAMYSAFAKRLYEAKNSNKAAIEIKDLKEKLRRRVPSIEEFSVAFSEVIYTNDKSKQKNLVRYILRKFSEYYGYSYKADFDELTIEHIHPQSKISLSWEEEVVGSLGNLIFIDEETNGALGTKTFSEKLKILRETKHLTPSFVQDSKSWTPDKVKKHTSAMAKVAYTKIWKI